MGFQLGFRSVSQIITREPLRVENSCVPGDKQMYTPQQYYRGIKVVDSGGVFPSINAKTLILARIA